jgi:general secretion pathway protein N
MRQGPVIALVGGLVFLAVAVATLPASLLAGRLPPELRAEGLGGSVWNGSAEALALRGAPLGALTWVLEPASLRQGRLEFRIELTRPDGYVRGHIGATFGGVITADGLELSLPITALTPGFAENGWRGEVSGTVRSARIEAGWPATLVGAFTLAQLHPPGSTVALGTYALDFDAGASTPQQLVGRLRDLEAPLSVRAQLRVQRERSYVLEGEVTPHPGAPPEVANAIAFLGAPDAAGRRAFAISGTF